MQCFGCRIWVLIRLMTVISHCLWVSDCRSRILPLGFVTRIFDDQNLAKTFHPRAAYYSGWFIKDGSSVSGGEVRALSWRIFRLSSISRLLLKGNRQWRVITVGFPFSLFFIPSHTLLQNPPDETGIVSIELWRREREREGQDMPEMGKKWGLQGIAIWYWSRLIFGVFPWL